MKGISLMLNRNDWYAPWFNRTAWIFENIQSLGLEPEEILTLLAINYLQESGQPITGDKISEKTSLEGGQIDDALTSLSDRGCLMIDTRNKQLTFVLDCLLDHAASPGHPLERSLLGEVQNEFGRPLSATEIERLAALAGEFEESTILHALDEAAAYDKRSVSYMEAVLASWKAKGLSAEDVENGRR